MPDLAARFIFDVLYELIITSQRSAPHARTTRAEWVRSLIVAWLPPARLGDVLGELLFKLDRDTREAIFGRLANHFGWWIALRAAVNAMPECPTLTCCPACGATHSDDEDEPVMTYVGIQCIDDEMDWDGWERFHLCTCDHCDEEFRYTGG